MADARPITFQDLMAVERISQPAVSPDGRVVAYVRATHDPVANTVRRSVWQVELATAQCTELTPGPGNHGAPAYSPDGRWLALVSSRDADLGSQIWLLPTAGGEARRVTAGHGGASALAWAPDSKRIAFVRSVVVSDDFQPAEGADPNKSPERAAVYGLVNPKSSARVEDALLFRHWDAWRDRRRSHVFVVDIDSGELADVTPGDRDAPPISLGSARDHDWSPDGRQLVFVRNPDAQVARSTNNCVYVVDIDGVQASAPPRLLSVTQACDNHPRFTPDGAHVVYIGMSLPMHEADKTCIKVVELATGQTRTLLEELDRDPHSFVFSDDHIVFLAQDRGRQSVYRVGLDGGGLSQLSFGTWNGQLCAVPGSDALVVTRQDARNPQDLYLLHPGPGISPLALNGEVQGVPPDAGCEARALTDTRAVLDGVIRRPAQEFWYTGADDTLLHGFVVKPPQEPAPGERLPLILLIHGGPQGAFSDDFHFRWNAQLFAAQGAAVAFLNPRGSTGYGRLITDQISGDWGGRVFDDIMAGLDALLALHPDIDPQRVAAAGASFGGFMVNWILGHSDRFKAIVSHDGIFFAQTMGYTTEELWFPTVEFGGMPDERRDMYERWSPHRAVANFKTPTLVVHGEQDFRCPISEGLGLFTALQLQGVPSRLLLFPDEGHWVTQPANAQVWWHEVVGWLMRYV